MDKNRFISMFSGIEAASVAWHGLGWEAVAFSEIEKFPCAVLKHRFPNVPNLGDMTAVDWQQYRGKVDMVCGGPPCQDFSVAGKGASLQGARGKLSVIYARAIRTVQPRWCLTENVPGWLSQKDNAFGVFLEELAGSSSSIRPPVGGWDSAGIVAGPVYGLAWRVLDAQYFGVPQRRNRVYIVGYLGDWRPAAKVLFESESLRGDSTPSEEAGEGVAKALRGRANSSHREDSDTFVTHSLRGEGHDASEDGTGRGVPLVYDMRGNGDSKTSPTLTREAAGDRPSDYAPIVFTQEQTPKFGAISGALDSQGERRTSVLHQMAVRRLTPTECERLQGFPDGHTNIPYRGKPAADGPRYKAIGNSWAVPVARWIVERIDGYEGK